jgi:peptidyl-prolyl cis-trans isomerase C
MAIRRLAVLASVLALAVGLGQAADPVVAKVGVVSITKSQYELQWGLFVRSSLRQQGQPYSEEAAALFKEQRPQFLERLARDQAIINAGKVGGFTAKPEEVEAAVEEAKGQFENEEALNEALKNAGIPDLGTYRALVTEAVTYNNYIESVIAKIQISPAAVQILYRLNKRQFAVPQTYCSSHILVRTAAEANQVIEQLGKGGKFEDIAQEKSLDPGSKNNGGELGCEPRGTFVPSFEASMAALKEGEYTRRPVQTEFGFHIILLIKVEPAGFRPFDSVKGSIEEELKNQALEKFVTGLADRSKIELFPENL